MRSSEAVHGNVGVRRRDQLDRAGLSNAPDGGTRLELDHVAHVDDELWEQFGPGATGVGWDMALMGLALHLATGEAVDPEQSAAWMASDEGRQFVARSSTKWSEASIAAGTDPDGAHAAAGRTTAFYTGDTAQP